MTTPAEEAQSAARSARRRAERQSVRDGVIVEPEATLPTHVYAMRREVEVAAAEEALREEETPSQPEEQTASEPAPEAPKATRSRKAAAK